MLPTPSTNGKHHTNGHDIDWRSLRTPEQRQRDQEDLAQIETRIRKPSSRATDDETDEDATDENTGEQKRTQEDRRLTTPLGELICSHLSQTHNDTPQSPISRDIEKAIAATLPAEGAKWGRKLFAFARNLRGILGNADVRTLRSHVMAWHRRAFGDKPFDETWTAFLLGWSKIKVPVGAKPALETAFARASAKPPVPIAVQLYSEGPLVLLAGICRELQALAGDADFYLDCRSAGRLLGLDHTTAWRCLNLLCTHGILIAGTVGSMATRRASRFRFIAEERDS